MSRVFHDTASVVAEAQRNFERKQSAKAIDDALAERLRTANAAKHSEVTGDPADFGALRHASLEARFAAGEHLSAEEKLSLANGRAFGYAPPKQPEPEVSPAIVAINEIAEIEKAIAALKPGSQGWTDAHGLLVVAEGKLSQLRHDAEIAAAGGGA